MTRENKLALVVGFGLILFVGILISDHFSTARTQESADLRAGRPVDPLVQVRRDNPTLIEVPGARSHDDANRGVLRPGPLAVNPGQIPHSNEDAAPPPATDETPFEPTSRPRREVPRIVMGGENGEPPAGSANVIFHDVRAGESLIQIARRHYGDDSLARELARYNNIADPNSIRVGHRLRIPPAVVLIRGEDASPPAAAAPQQPVYTTYTVKRGDSLSQLAQELLGSARRWRELHQLNVDVIRDPDNLQVGTVLRVPRPGA